MRLGDVLGEATQHDAVHLQEVAQIHKDDLRVVHFGHDIAVGVRGSRKSAFQSAEAAGGKNQTYAILAGGL